MLGKESDICVLGTQLLAGSVTFRDESSPDEEAAYVAASQACMKMWDRHVLQAAH